MFRFSVVILLIAESRSFAALATIPSARAELGESLVLFAPAGASRHFIMRLTNDERTNYQRAADRAGVSLSGWIREKLTKAAKRESKRD